MAGSLALLAKVHHEQNASQEYAVDSMPIPVCDNIRIRRCRLYRLEKTDGAFRAYCASMKRFFQGLKVHLAITTRGLPVQAILTPGCLFDITAFQSMPLVLAEGSRLFADCGCLDDAEAVLQAEATRIKMVAQRRGSSNCQLG